MFQQWQWQQAFVEARNKAFLPHTHYSSGRLRTNDKWHSDGADTSRELPKAEDCHLLIDSPTNLSKCLHLYTSTNFKYPFTQIQVHSTQRRTKIRIAIELPRYTSSSSQWCNTITYMVIAYIINSTCITSRSYSIMTLEGDTEFCAVDSGFQLSAYSLKVVSLDQHQKGRTRIFFLLWPLVSL